MPTISPLKEAFAFSTIADREKVLEKFSNAEDARYYQGLVLLQKLYDEIMNQENPLALREPSKVEAVLIEQINALLNKYNDYEKHRNHYQELNARFQLLSYPINASKSTDFIRQELNLELSKKQEAANIASVPSKLDPQLVDSESLTKKSLQDLDNSELEYAAIPAYIELLQSGAVLLSDNELSAFVRKLLSYPTEHYSGILEMLVNIWKENEDEDNTQWFEEYIPYDNLTLKQLSWLLDAVPEIVCKLPGFVQSYLQKLVPSEYHRDQANVWDDDEGYLLEYLNRAEEFIERLPLFYTPLNASVKFYKLRNNIARNTFHEEKLIEYLRLYSGKANNVSSPTPTRFGSVAPNPPPSEICPELPLFGSHDRSMHLEVLEEYLTGLDEQKYLTKTPEELGAYEDYNMLTSLFKKVKLATGSIKTVDNPSDVSLAQKSMLSFSSSSVYRSVKRKPEDDITLTIKTRNIDTLSIRVFQINTETYWKLHPTGELTEDINLDGLRPTWEYDQDFSDESPLLIKRRDFVFGNNGLAPEVFAGRGVWVVEFVGGNNQCRAIFQKGYLRHTVQNTVAGHLVKVIDENNNLVDLPRAIYNDQTYQADQSHSILIPYSSTDDGFRPRQMVLVSPSDGFCEPKDFYQELEEYNIEATFHVNHEMLSFNKRATVSVVPKLVLQGVPYSLIESATLKVECTNVHDIKSTTTTAVSSLEKPFSYVFSVPELLNELVFTLEVKVKTLSKENKTISTTYSYPLQRNNGQPANVCLKKDADGQYLIFAFGANGEPIEGKEISLTLTHGLTSYQTHVVLQSSKMGIVELGELDGISSIKYKGQTWNLVPSTSFPLLPSVVNVGVDEEFKIPYEDCFVYKMGYQDNLLEYISEGVVAEDGHVTISGLSEGVYKVFLQNPKHTRWISSDQDYITCTVVKNQVDLKDKLWKNWVIGEHYSGQKNSYALQKPLEITSCQCTDDLVDIELSNWSAKTYAVVSACTFIPSTERSLLQRGIDSRSLGIPQLLDNATNHTRSLFLDDKQISEEYQYILNRSRSEKWAGSNLAYPSLLIHPKENHTTTSETKNLERGGGLFGSAMAAGAPASAMRRKLKSAAARMCLPEDKGDVTSFEFLNHESPIIVVPVDSVSGHILIDRKLLGDNSSFLECMIVSEEQTTYRALHTGLNEIKYNDMRQQKNEALVRSKTIRTVLPNKSVELDASEIETVDTIGKLLDTICLISSVGEEAKEKFEPLRNWSDLSFKKKKEAYSELVCHEMNFWLKKKDNEFFKLVVFPGIKSKIRKSFMDLYLLEEDLSWYAKNIYAFEKLNTAEKSLLAKTQPKEFLDAVLKKFKDSIDESQKDGKKSDAVFDVVFAGSTQINEAYDSDEDMGFSMSEPDVAAQYSNIASQSAFRSNTTSSLFGARPPEPGIESYEVVEEDEGNEEAYEKLREKAKELQKQNEVKYSFVKPTAEWKETGYHDEYESISITQFWVDYIEHEDVFLSPNFVHNLNNATEIVWVLCLMDLPFENNWERLYDNVNKKTTIKSGKTSPLILLYRNLSEMEEAQTSLNSLVVCEQLFVYDRHSDVSSDECVKIDPKDTALEVQTHYGSQLILSNLSSKTVYCDLTYQIPVGSVPLESFSYRLSKSISIQPYSTWSEITGTFYFPKAGAFCTVSATVSVESNGQQLLTRSTPSNLSVTDSDTLETQGVSSSVYWPSVASRGSNESVLSYLKTYKRLDRIDLSLINWRMTSADFARDVFNVLTYDRCFFSEALSKYGLYHQFSDVLKNLLEFKRGYLLKKVGQTFSSPLISVSEPNVVHDYYPLVVARAHSLQPTKKEILNKEFSQSYDCFLDYLCELTAPPTATDFIMLTQYLILQNRIGEAQHVFTLIDLEQAGAIHPIQTDYLNIYLQTRIRLTDQEPLIQLDLAPIKETLSKYVDFGIQTWREKFNELREFVHELERGFSSNPLGNSISSHPVLEFSIDPKSQELVIQHANIKSVTIGYYEMNIEVMFSENPFMGDAVVHDAFKLIKPTSVDIVELKELDNQKEDVEEDFDMIGVGQVQSANISRIPFKGGNKNMMIEIKANDFISDTTAITQRLEKSNAYYSNSLNIHMLENFGIVRVISENTKRPLVGAYVKVYARLKKGKKVEFWKDGYTGLNGVFDYMSVTEGNALIGNYANDLETLVAEKIDKLSVLIMSQEGAVVKEVYPPLT
ncbi:hypothetical protein BY458DRAFT_20638 [Sporodiniella umbellata]|nr:hypothetical protein BY458DRAFT_20638 [Sporodiniella umbellata]